MTIHEGQVVVVTGGASGIGRAIAERFAAAGASVVVADLDETGAKTVAADIGPSARAIGCDVADEAQVDAAAELAVEEFGSLDVKVNNAGICVLGPLHQLTGSDFGRMICGQLEVHPERHQGCGPADGRRRRDHHHVVDCWTQRGAPAGWLRRHQGRHHQHDENRCRRASPAGIRVNCVCPAFTETPFRVLHPLHHVGGRRVPD